jgi:tetratricopeptide (TPR) repeat protein
VVAFQLGALAALLQLILVMRRAKPTNRLILGANLYLLGGGLAAFTQQWWVLRGYGALLESGVFLFMLVVGTVATVATPTGFLTVTEAAATRVRTASLVMLAATAVALVASVVFRGEMRASAWVPVTMLALVERALTQRLRGGDPAASALPRTTRVAGAAAAAILLGTASPFGAASQTVDAVAQARAALDADRVDDALGILEKAVAADTQNASALAWLGTARIRKARAIGGMDAATWVKRGFDALDETVERFPDAFIGYLLRGINGSQVPDLFRKAPAAVKDLRTAYLHLGIAHKKSGQRDEARAAWEKGRTLYPAAPEASAIDRELRGL